MLVPVAPEYCIASASTRPLLTAHVRLTVLAETNARKLQERFGQGTVFSAWLVE